MDQAEVRRYRGAVLNDTMTGKLIIYENLTDVFSIDGQRTEEGGKASGGRVKAVLAPHSKTMDKKP
jgi:lipopolysaccharide export system protein LptA